MRAALYRLLARVRAFFSPAHLDRDFNEELESHLQMLSEENVRRGMTPEEARRAALIRLGSPASLTAQHRDQRGFPAAEAIVQDVRFAWRLLAKDRWYSAAAIAALALGIGANAAGLLDHQCRAPARTAVRATPIDCYVLSWLQRSGRRANVSYADLQDWQSTSRSFEALAAYRNGTINISGDRAMPEQVSGTWLTANAFSVLGQRPILGRDFMADDERPAPIRSSSSATNSGSTDMAATRTSSAGSCG